MTDGNPSYQSGQRRYLLVRIGSSKCAIDLANVRRILRGVLVYPIPGSRPQLLGLAHWRGEPLAILDLLVMLGASEPAAIREPVTVVVRIGEGDSQETLGLAVNEALEVVRIAPDRITTSGQVLVRGEVMVGPEVVRIIDLESLGADA